MCGAAIGVILGTPSHAGGEQRSSLDSIDVSPRDTITGHHHEQMCRIKTSLKMCVKHQTAPTVRDALRTPLPHAYIRGHLC